MNGNNKYFPAFLFPFDEKGKCIINELEAHLDDTQKKVIKIIDDLEEFDYEKAKKIRQNAKDLKITLYDLPLCVFILIFPKSDNIDNVKKYYQDKIAKEDREKIVFVSVVDQIYKEFSDIGTLFLAMNVTNRDEKLDDIQIKQKVIAFLLSFLCSKILEIEEFRKLFSSKKFYTFGTEAFFLPRIELRVYLKNKLISDYIDLAYNKKDIELTVDECKNEIINCIFFEDSYFKKNVKYPVLPFRFPFFSGVSYREELKKEYCKRGKETLRSFFSVMKEEASKYRKDLEKKLSGKISNVFRKFLDFVFGNIKSMKNYGKLLSEIVNNKMDELINENKRQLKWPILKNEVFEFNVDSFTRWPNLFILFILFFAFCLINIFSYYFLGFSQIFFAIFIISASVIAFYVVSSRILLAIAENKFRKIFVRKLKEIEDFFVKSCESLENIYKNFILYFLKWKLGEYYEEYKSLEKYLFDRLENAKKEKEKWEKENKEISEIINKYKIDGIFNLKEFLQRISERDKFFEDLFFRYLKENEYGIVNEIVDVIMKRSEEYIKPIKDLNKDISLLCGNKINLSTEKADFFVTCDDKYVMDIKKSADITFYGIEIPGFLARIKIQGLRNEQ